MTPTATATARRPGAVTAGGPRATPSRAPVGDRRPPLEIVAGGPRRRPRERRHSIGTMLAISSLVVSLLAVVVGQAVLASGQVRLSRQEAKVAAAQAEHRTMELATAELQTPSRIVARAEQQLHMQQPSQVTQLPSVPLDVPVGAPTIVAAPATTTTTAPAATTATTAPAATTATTAPAATAATTPGTTPGTTPTPSTGAAGTGH